MRRGISQQKKESEVLFSGIHLINMDISQTSDVEFRIMIIRILAGIEKKHKRH